MPKYEVMWIKTYYAADYVEIEANSKEEAEGIARENIGNYEGSKHYDDTQSSVWATELKTDEEETDASV